MKKVALPHSCLAVALLALALAAPLPALAQATDMQARNRLNMLEQRLDELQAGGGGGASPNVAALVETRLGDVQNQQRSLVGQLEQLQFQNRQLQTALERLQQDHEARLQALESPANAAMPAPASMAPANVAPNGVSTAPRARLNADDTAALDDAIRGTLGDISVRDGQVTGARVEPNQPTLPTPPADFGLTADEQYDRAFGLLRQADYEQAQGALESFIAKNPKHRLVPNAQYWLAETYYVREDFGQAASAFAKSFETAPTGSKAPDSLLKLAMSLGKLGRKDDACVTLASLNQRFPRATPAVRASAEAEAKELQCTPARRAAPAAAKPAANAPAANAPKATSTGSR